MNYADPIALQAVSPEEAIAALRHHDGPVLLDLDETLYLSNSTEDFIDSARPGVLALLLMRLLDLVQPWRWTGGEMTRDVWRVRLVLLLFPWTARRWRSRVSELATQFTNQSLVTALKARGTPPIITTIGFQTIVAPLVAALGLPEARIVAARHSSFEDRRSGKLSLALKALGKETVHNGLVITDSPQDLPLLQACALPIFTFWPGVRYRRALSGVYVPGQYLTQVKRPGERYILRGVLQEDFAFWVLSSVALAGMPVLHVLGLVFLLVSFWAVYELGYVDNDRIAERFEIDPKLTAAYRDTPVAMPRWEPWIWATFSGVIAIVLLRWPMPVAPADLAKWAGLLVAMRLWFLLYNRLDKGTRVWMYAGLQMARTAAFAVLVPITTFGAMALGAHVLARWIPYYVYRLGGNAWPDAPFYLTRLLFLAALAVVMVLAQGVAPLWNWTALAVSGWTLFRARHELKSMLQAATRLDRSKDRPQ